MESELIHKIFSIPAKDFETLSLEIFLFQYANNAVYRQFVEALHVIPGQVDSICKIPFLPIRFFKSHVVKTTSFFPQIIFESSGTTDIVNSRHYIKECQLYERSFISGFETFYGKPGEWCIIGLLPSYLERKNSSLIMMVDRLIKMSHHPKSGFYLYEHDKLYSVLTELKRQRQKTILIGVTFALLDFAEKFAMKLEDTIVMETGGMKGRREEMTREEVHDILKERFGIKNVHSEYGMTELLSQAYSKGDGIFQCP